MNSTHTGTYSAAQRAKSVFGSAARLARKQAELATLNTVTLTKLYYAIGKHLVSVEKLPPDLEQKRAEIRDLEARNSAVDRCEAEPTVEPSGAGFAARAAQFAQKATQKAAKATGDAARNAQIQAGYVVLGKTAAEKYGEKSVPKELRLDYAEATDRKRQLVEEIASLKAEGSGRWLTPWRALQVAGMAVVLMLGWFLFTPGPNGSGGNPDWLTQHDAIESIEQAIASVPHATAAASGVRPTQRHDSDAHYGDARASAIDNGNETWRLVPPETKALIDIDVRNAVQAPQWQKNQARLTETTYGQQSLAALAEVEAKYGFRYERDLDRLLVAFPIPDGNPFSEVLMIAYGDFKPERIAAVMAAFDGAAISRWQDTAILRVEQQKNTSVYIAFLSPECALLSLDADAVRNAISRATDGSGGLSPSLAAAMRSQLPGTHAFLGISPNAFAKAPPDIKELAENANWGSVSLDSNRPDPGATLTVQAKTAEAAESWERWFERTVMTDASGNENFQGFSGGIRPMSEAVQVLRNGRTIKFVLKDLR